MNCQDHLYKNQQPKQVARRWFLRDCALGLGAMAASQLQGANVNPLAPTEGEERDLPLHGGGAESSGIV